MKEDFLSVAKIRFYAELNDFLPALKKRQAFLYRFFGRPTVKALIEEIGVPHTEIDLILVNGESVSFNHHVKHDDHISVYPQFESLDISSITHLRPKPLRKIKFIADVHLGKLARYLRMLGFDTHYARQETDGEIIDLSVSQKRLILTRDLGILKNSRVTHGYFLRHTNPKQQLREVVDRFDLKGLIAPFTRCLDCNGRLVQVDKNEIAELLQTDTRRYFETFFRCSGCQRIYWEGSHHERMRKLISFLN
jgi:uncharacterized protein with PIN domain